MDLPLVAFVDERRKIEDRVRRFGSPKSFCPHVCLKFCELRAIMFIVKLLFKQRVKYARSYCFKSARTFTDSTSTTSGLMLFGLGTGSFTLTGLLADLIDWFFPKPATDQQSLEAHKKQKKIFADYFARKFRENHFDEVKVCASSSCCWRLSCRTT